MVYKTIPKKVKNEINKFVETLKDDKLPIQKVILFGSYARKKQHKWSDIDVCIISTRFKNPWKATGYLWSKRKISDVRYTIEPIGFSPKDFHEGSSLINEIKKTGIEIKI